MRLLVIPALALLSSCAPIDGTRVAPAASISRTASLFAVDKDNPAGPLNLHGTAAIIQDGSTAKLIIDTVLPGKGEYGMHIHTVGKCDPPDFTTAGPHWNPEGRQHGRDNPAGAHHGDLPNVRATDLTGTHPYLSKEIDLGVTDINSLFDADSASLIIHEKADDYSTDPSGNSGKRLICGVFTKG